MAENTKPEDLEVTDVTELEDGDLESASGGVGIADQLDDNTNCGNTQCCG